MKENQVNHTIRIDETVAAQLDERVTFERGGVATVVPAGYGYHVARDIHRLGYNVIPFTITRSSSGITKKPAVQWNSEHAPWGTERQPSAYPADIERYPGWAAEGGYRNGRMLPSVNGLGVVCGIQGYTLLDFDKPGNGKAVPDSVIRTALDALGLPSAYLWQGASRSGLGYHIAIELARDTEIPAGWVSGQEEKGVYLFRDTSTHQRFGQIELRIERCMGVLPAYGYRPGYRTERAATIPLSRVIAALHQVGTEPLTPAPKPTQAPKLPQPDGHIADADALRDTLDRAFDGEALVQWFARELGGETREETAGEVRIAGHNGLLVHVPDGKWYMHGQQDGGGWVKAIAHTRYGGVVPTGAGWFDLLRTAADFCRVPIETTPRGTALKPKQPERVRAVDTQAPKPPAPATPTIGTLGALMAKKFAPVRWVIPELLPEGAVILAGAPKQGKSLLALNIALAVSAGSVALGCKITNPGAVLYLALEDGERRLQDRVRGITARGVQAGDGFHYATDWPKTDEHGATYIDTWLDGHPDAQLVVIDTLKKVRPSRKSGEDLYDFDYHALDIFHQVATQRRVCVLIIHHTRKAESDDYLETLSGSNAIAGAVDGVMVLKKPRNNPDGILHITGRDIDETELALRMDYPVWTLLGDAAAERMTQEYKAVLGALHGGVALGIKDVLDAVGPLDPKANYNTVRQRLYQMKEKGILLAEGGRYRINPANHNLVKHPNNPNNPNNPNSPNSPNNVVRVPGDGDTLQPSADLPEVDANNVVSAPGDSDTTPKMYQFIAGLDAAIQTKLTSGYLAELMGGE